MNLFLLLFVSANLWADVTLSAYRSNAESPDSMEIVFGEKKVTIIKKSNWLAEKDDYRLGKFSVKQSNNTILAELIKTKADLVKTRENLKKFGTNLPESTRHGTVLKLDQDEIPQESIHYEKILKIIQKVSQEKFQHDEGIMLSRDHKYYVVIKDGKELTREKFNQDFFCEKGGVPLRCLARNWGSILYYPEK